jgi:crossover junction endodeoxyribonuclease RuvC
LQTIRILGIDPGSVKTGFGIIEVQGQRIQYVTSGVIRLKAKEAPTRLGVIFESVQELIEEHKPNLMAVEEVFMAKNPSSALKLGQARGAAMTAGVVSGLPVAEYAARLVKQSIAGSGAADKSQVQYMVTKLLKLSAEPSEDAADALAIAICHFHHSRYSNENTETAMSNKKT